MSRVIERVRGSGSRPEGREPAGVPWLDRWGVPVAAAAAALFAVLAVLAVFHESSLLQVDRPIQRAVIGAREPWLDRAMVYTSLLGTRYVIGALLALLAAWVFATGRCKTLLLVLVVAFALNPLVEWALKLGMDRARPDLLRLVRGRGPSFPSGHVLASIGFYGMLPLLAWEATRRTWIRALAIAGGTTVLFAVGFSRIYLGVHWASDVVGGFLLGVVVVLGTYLAFRGHHLHRSRDCCGGDEPPRRSESAPREAQPARTPSSLAR